MGISGGFTPRVVVGLGKASLPANKGLVAVVFPSVFCAANDLGGLFRGSFQMEDVEGQVKVEPVPDIPGAQRDVSPEGVPGFDAAGDNGPPLDPANENVRCRLENSAAYDGRLEGIVPGVNPPFVPLALKYAWASESSSSDTRASDPPGDDF